MPLPKRAVSAHDVWRSDADKQGLSRVSSAYDAIPSDIQARLQSMSWRIRSSTCTSTNTRCEPRLLVSYVYAWHRRSGHGIPICQFHARKRQEHIQSVGTYRLCTERCLAWPQCYDATATTTKYDVSLVFRHGDGEFVVQLDRALPLSEARDGRRGQ